MCLQVNAERAQARERAGHSLLVFRLHDMEMDLQVVDGRLNAVLIIRNEEALSNS